MATRSTTAKARDEEVLRAILSELQALNLRVGEIAERIAAQAQGDLAPGRAIDPGDAVPPGVAPEAPMPLTPEDKKVRRALERLPKARRGGPSKR